MKVQNPPQKRRRNLCNTFGMHTLRVKGDLPAADDLVKAVYRAAEVLDIWECYAVGGRYHFALGDGWSVAVSADSADRVRVEACRLSKPVTTMWTLAHRRDRLAGLVRRLSTVPEAA